MSNRTKEELIEELNKLDIQLDRVIKLPIILDEPEERGDIDSLINDIIKLTKELSKL